MGDVILIYGKPGSGKSHSLQNFGEDEILLIQAERKRLPFRGKFKYTLVSDQIITIEDQLKKMPCKTAVIDDAGYILSNMFMRSIGSGKTGSKVYDLYNEIGFSFWHLFNFIKDLPDDIIVYFIMHEDTTDSGETKLRTIGKLLDEKVVLDGKVTICLRCMSKEGRHFFRTVTDSYDITKSPSGLFDEEEIPNDLKLVDDKIRNFYGIGGKK